MSQLLGSNGAGRFKVLGMIGMLALGISIGYLIGQSKGPPQRTDSYDFTKPIKVLHFTPRGYEPKYYLPYSMTIDNEKTKIREIPVPGGEHWIFHLADNKVIINATQHDELPKE